MKLVPSVLPFGRSRFVRSSACTVLPGPFRHAALLVRGTAVNAMLLALAAALLLTAKPAQAANLLVNPSFENNSGHNIPVSWTRFAPPTAQLAGNYWIEGNVTPQQGSLYFKEWGACYNSTNNAAGIYQDLSIAPGSTYQASGWFYTRSSDTLGPNSYVWIEVLFVGSSSNLLALYRSDQFNAAVGTDNWFQYQVNHACDVSSPVSIGDPYFNTYALTGTVSQLVPPVGTTTVRYRFVYVQGGSDGGSCYFDSAVLNEIGPVLPVITAQPQGQTAVVGSTVMLAVSAERGGLKMG